MTTAISTRKIEANRLNAKNSTGPKTPGGKAISRLNALKHGILARQVVVQGYKITESSREFKNLHREFYQHLTPVGPLEEMLVDQIIVTVWRLRRARTAESGEIALSVDRGWNARQQKENLQLRFAEWQAFGDVSLNMEGSCIGTMLLNVWLAEVYEAIEREGELTEAVLKQLIQQFGGKHNIITRKLEELRSNLPENLSHPDAAILREKCKDDTLAWLDGEMNRIEKLTRDFRERDNKNETASQAAYALPEAETMDKIIRYESSLSRQLFQAMDQLEHLQRRRLGENVPPPMIVGVTAERIKLPNEPTANLIDLQ
jgi:hypothetical protein